MYALKLVKNGNSLGVRMPKEMVNELGVSEGEVIYFVRTPEGFTATGNDPEFGKFLEVTKEVMTQYRNALSELAK